MLINESYKNYDGIESIGKFTANKFIFNETYNQKVKQPPQTTFLHSLLALALALASITGIAFDDSDGENLPDSRWQTIRMLVRLQDSREFIYAAASTRRKCRVFYVCVVRS